MPNMVVVVVVFFFFFFQARIQADKTKLEFWLPANSLKHFQSTERAGQRTAFDLTHIC